MYKITFFIQTLQLTFTLIGISSIMNVVAAQPLEVVTNKKNYKQEVRKDEQQKMIELKWLIPGIIYDLQYATSNNFTGKKLYQQSRYTYLRLPAAMALKKVQAELQQQGRGLMIFDAYRPYSVTKMMWNLIKDERYVANPASGSGHNRGLSVDLTIVDLLTGKPLDMGTSFDNFTDTAHHNFKQLAPEVLQNRLLLKTTMEKYGFRALSTEWWHYSWPNTNGFKVLDIDFRKLKD
jgi:D-alanyl-D-alanine dipeptidase